MITLPNITREEFARLADDMNSPGALLFYRQTMANSNVGSFRAVALLTQYDPKHPMHCAGGWCRAVDGGGYSLLCVACALAIRERYCAVEIGRLRRDAEELISSAERSATHFIADGVIYAAPLADDLRARLVRRLMIGREVSAQIVDADGRCQIAPAPLYEQQPGVAGELVAASQGAGAGVGAGGARGQEGLGQWR